MLESTALGVVWRHRALLLALTRRDIQNRYAGSLIGVVWALLNPLALLALYALVFEAIFRVKVPDLQLGQPYVLFVALALWPWMAFQEGVVRGTGAIQQNAALVKKVAFNHEILVYSAVLASFAVHGLGFGLVLLVLGLSGFQIHWAGLGVSLLWFLVLWLMSMSMALLLSSLQVFVRDVEQFLAQFMSVLFYTTPILFPMSIVPNWLANVMQLNPLVHALDPVRAHLLSSLPFDALEWVIGMLLTLLALAAARWFFLRLSPYFEDML
jgi:ABC-type polysaccharide/polyol phosphate export permease